MNDRPLLAKSISTILTCFDIELASELPPPRAHARTKAQAKLTEIKVRCRVRDVCNILHLDRALVREQYASLARSSGNRLAIFPSPRERFAGGSGPRLPRS